MWGPLASSRMASSATVVRPGSPSATRTATPTLSRPRRHRLAKAKRWPKPAAADGGCAITGAAGGLRASWRRLVSRNLMALPHPLLRVGIPPHLTPHVRWWNRTRMVSSRSAAGDAGRGAHRPSRPGRYRRSWWGCASTAWPAHMSRRNAPTPPGALTAGARATGPMLARFRRGLRAPSVAAPRLRRRGAAESLVTTRPLVIAGLGMRRMTPPPRGLPPLLVPRRSLSATGRRPLHRRLCLNPLHCLPAPWRRTQPRVRWGVLVAATRGL